MNLNDRTASTINDCSLCLCRFSFICTWYLCWFGKCIWLEGIGDKVKRFTRYIMRTRMCVLRIAHLSEIMSIFLQERLVISFFILINVIKNRVEISDRHGIRLICMRRLSALGRCGHVNLSADTCRHSTRRNIRVPCLQRVRNLMRSSTISPHAPKPNTRKLMRNSRWWCRGINTTAAG